MAPKIKTTLEATPDSEDTEISPPAKVPKRKAKARPQVPPAETARTPKRKSEKKTQKEPLKYAPGTPRGKPTKESVFITEVASKCVLHQDVVSSVLDAVQAVAVDTLKTKRKFAVGFSMGVSPSSLRLLLGNRW